MNKGRLGIFGGTFDPPHVGHLILAESALDGFGLRQVLFVLNADPPHKQGVTPVRHRIAMLENAIKGNPRFELSRVEIDRPGPHYTYQTLQLLAEQYRDSDLYFLMGGDSLRDFPTWHQPDQILECARLGVMRRAGETFNMTELSVRIPQLASRVEFMDTPEVGISASSLRVKIRAGHSIRYQVSDGVADYIRTHLLYEDV